MEDNAPEKEGGMIFRLYISEKNKVENDILVHSSYVFYKKGWGYIHIYMHVCICIYLYMM